LTGIATAARNAGGVRQDALWRGEPIVKLVVLSLAVATMLAVVPSAAASDTPAETAALCAQLFGST